MTTNPHTEWIQEKIEGQIKHFKSSRNYHRKSSFAITIASATLSGFTTFFIGISEVVGLEGLSIAALASSAILSVLTSVASAYSYRDHWIRSNNTLMDLYELQSDISYAVRKFVYLSDHQADTFYERYIYILKSSNTKWDEQRKNYEG
jgi:hypothetical protein